MLISCSIWRKLETADRVPRRQPGNCLRNVGWVGVVFNEGMYVCDAVAGKYLEAFQEQLPILGTGAIQLSPPSEVQGMEFPRRTGGLTAQHLPNHSIHFFISIRGSDQQFCIIISQQGVGK